ncbi:RagB/SusD family nutrient uptake outer membrane protein, partial [Marivirga lumbricoides]
QIVQFTGRYETEYVNAVNAGINIWSDRYTPINECNIVINLINDESVEGDQGAKDVLIGEAKFLRALFYHDLARTVGYEPGREVNGFNLSAILRTEPTLGSANADDRPRATNLEVYEQIEEDLLDAIQRLPEVGAGTSAVARANKTAAELLLARVYLYWGRNTEAADYAQRAIAGDGSDLVDAADYVESWDDAAFNFHPESVFESDLQVPDWSSVDGANNSLHSLLMNNTSGSQFIITASDELVQVIESEPSDVRSGLLNTENLGQEFAKWQGNKGTLPFQENIPILRLSEGYLIAAEALGPGAGDVFLNTFRAARGLAGGVSATVDNVLREKRIEYMAEGHRWYDLKRLGRDIPKPAAADVDPVPYENFRILPRLPQSEIELSDDILVQNPNYN